ncbi:ATP-binding protein [Cryptosporangium arvum]|uniref:Anti-sigma regulatory factor (Ser/Thr protein kinase) n=1 Tax=Cryptosporangium arvum DSM 44712 TaxID=927661 RepID=A0A011A0E9_9ACTN|nr:ATP-binding protein [Cryptosporangium arvum]EXG82967.1 anti-sigma regulatory factor (Ser/Thr protein kinase) [Cryptosporangium arvum DSM 44712]
MESLIGAETLWIPIDDTSAVGAARRMATGLAGRAGFDEARTGELAIAVTELAGNLHRHAHHGAVALRLTRPYLSDSDTADPAVEVVALDAGPGLEDFEAHLRDGYSTGGTLGVGLGAVTRLASTFDAWSQPGRGTVVAARFAAPRRPLTRIGQPAQPGGERAAGLTRPMAGESACGDAYAVRRTADGVVAVLCDGLGHGPLAARAAQRAVEVFLDTADEDVTALVTRLHRELKPTRGAAVGVVRHDVSRGLVQFAGLGNIAGAVLWAGERGRHLTSMPGIAGHQARTIRSFDYPAAENALIVLHTDGLNSRWSFDGQWGLAGHDPLVIASVLLRDAGTRRDDAGVLVLKCRP